MTGKQPFQEDTIQLVLRRPVERAASCFSFLFLFAMWKIKQEVGREDILYHMNTFYHPPNYSSIGTWWRVQELKVLLAKDSSLETLQGQQPRELAKLLGRVASDI